MKVLPQLEDELKLEDRERRLAVTGLLGRLFSQVY
jgi:hypothetical protein